MYNYYIGGYNRIKTHPRDPKFNFKKVGSIPYGSIPWEPSLPYLSLGSHHSESIDKLIGTGFLKVWIRNTVTDPNRTLLVGVYRNVLNQQNVISNRLISCIF